MAKETLTQKRAALTERCVKARQEYRNTYNLVKYEVRKANPGLMEKDWVKFYGLVDNDPRVQEANARLLAFCEAANIIGADIG